MQLNKLIIETINEYFSKPQVLKEDLDLNNKKNIYTWLQSNGPNMLFDDDGNIDSEYIDPMTGDDLDTLISKYREKYNEISSDKEIEIYRLLKLKTIKDLNLKNVGVFWSFEESSVGAYGVEDKIILGSKTFILNATVKTNNIDWGKGFSSFLLWGKTEFECYVKKGSECIQPIFH